jgi:endonuclease-3
MDIKARTLKIIELLSREYPDAHTALDFSTPIEIVVATILSAQSTDKTANKITEKLFKKYKVAKDYAKADIKKFEVEIHSSGFYHSKAKNIINMAKKLVADFGGKVPDTMDELITLPGVARKTANIVLTSAFNKHVGIAVDTHVRRLSQRLGLTKNDDPDKIEQDLLKIVPQKNWGKFNFYFVDHGRAICDAKKPKCPDCVLGSLCPSKASFFKKFWSQNKSLLN